MPAAASSRSSQRVPSTLAALLLLYVFAAGPLHASPREARYLGGVQATVTNQFLRALIHAQRFYDLRWPNISDVRGDLEKLYAGTRFTPVWVQEGRPTPQALQAIQVLQQADSEGLNPEDYDASRWPERLAALQRPHVTADDARFDVALTVSVMRYVSAVRVGRTHPAYLHLNADPKGLDLPTFVKRRLAQGDNVSSELASLDPTYPGYQALRRALARYEQLAKQDDGQKLPMPADIGYPGPPYAGFVRLATLLRLLGDLPADYNISEARAQVFDPDLIRGVESFQRHHGLPASGYLNADTINELNVPLSERVQQIRLALERYRWVRYSFVPPMVVVNVAAYRLYAFNADGSVALGMKVDVGDDSDGTRTPLMEDDIEYLVFRPSWDVPVDIQRNEVVPEIANDPAYLTKFHFDVLTPAGRVVTSTRVSPAELHALRTGRLRMRQRPGEDNAMGLVKFVFPNRFSVYLHDIPARQFYFSQPQRVVSHGCVHLEKPAELAAWMLRNQWNLQRVRQAMNDGPNNRTVRLPKAIPVLFFYNTVIADDNGEIFFFRDIYGYDRQLLAALQRGYPYTD